MSQQPQYPPYASQSPPQYGQAPGPPPLPAPTGYDLQHFKIMDDSIRIAPTNQILYGITRPDTKFSFSLSEKPPIQVGNSQTGLLLGTIRTSKMSQDVEFTIHGRATAIKVDPWTGSKWYYTSVFSPSGTLWWSQDKYTSSADKGGLTLRDAKKDGQVIAELKNDILKFQMSGLGQGMMDEVMVSAVAMVEAMEKKRKQDKVVTKVILKAALGV